jgi:hypothetical protein
MPGGMNLALSAGCTKRSFIVCGRSPRLRKMLAFDGEEGLIQDPVHYPACPAGKMDTSENALGHVDDVFEERVSGGKGVPEIVTGLHVELCLAEIAGQQPVGLFEEDRGATPGTLMLDAHDRQIFSPQELQ